MQTAGFKKWEADARTREGIGIEPFGEVVIKYNILREGELPLLLFKFSTVLPHDFYVYKASATTISDNETKFPNDA